MAGSITVSSITLDSDNNFSILSNTGATIFFANTSGVDVANSIGATAITNDKILSVANTKISGNIISSQITSVANTQLTGTLIASQIASVNATTATSGTLPTARLPAGSVLQVVNGNTSTSVTTTTTETWIDTGITATITPTSASSKIMVMANICGIYKSDSSVWNRMGIRLLRDATVIGIPSLANLYTATTLTLRVPGVMYSKLDEPATTSATTYKVQFQVEALATGTGVSVQRDGNSGESQIFLMEIAA